MSVENNREKTEFGGLANRCMELSSGKIADDKDREGSGKGCCSDRG